MNGLSYYAQLARRMAPVDLARAAARRAYRVARRALPPPAPPSRRALLVSHGCSSAEELVTALASPSEPFFLDARERTPVVTSLAGVPSARERVLARAERAAAGRLRLFGTQISVSAGSIDWALEPVSGRRYPMVPASSLPLVQSGMDPKYPWALGRLESLVALAQGHWVAEGEAQGRYARAAVEQLLDFVEANPPGVGIQWTCPMEVALRAANMALALRMLARSGALGGERWFKALQSLALHADHVEAHLEDEGAVPNNHLLANYVGLAVVAAAFPRLSDSPRHRALAVKGLREELQRQVHPDGVSFEGSVPYHRLALELFTLAYVALGDGASELGMAYADRLKRMYRVVSAYCSERGLAPQLGDNDSGRAWPFTDRPSLDHGYLLAVGAALFADGTLRCPTAEWNEDAAWLLGEAGARAFAALPVEATERTFSSRAGGLHVLRGGGAVVSMSAGPLGQRGAGGHNHNDQLAFELHVDGWPVIADPGSPTYTADPARRNAYRATAAHATWQLDGREQSPLDPSRLFSLADRTRTELEALRLSAERQQLVASHRAWGDPPAGVRVRRALALETGQRLLAVEDAFLGAGRHEASLRICFPGPLATVRAASRAEWERLAAADRAGMEPGQMRAVEYGEVCAPRAVLLFAPGLLPVIEPYDYSPGYGQTRAAARVVLRRALELPASVRWWVLF